jgi:hypothetical protein
MHHTHTDRLPPQPIHIHPPPSPGFVAVPGFASPEEVAAMRGRAGQLVEAFDPASISIFSTKDDNQVRV